MGLEVSLALVFSAGVGPGHVPGLAGSDGAGGWFGWLRRGCDADQGGAAFAGGLFVFGQMGRDGRVLDFDLAFHG